MILRSNTDSLSTPNLATDQDDSKCVVHEEGRQQKEHAKCHGLVRGDPEEWQRVHQEIEVVHVIYQKYEQASN